MRQVVFTRYGAPEVLTVQEAARPAVGADEVGISVRAAGVNFADVMARMGLYPDAPKPPLVPGYEVAGVVDQVGSGVRHVHEGDRVVALTRFGGYATQVVVPAEYVFAIPPEVSDTDAAALPVNYLMASPRSTANLTAGETVLIHGAGGGVALRRPSSRDCGGPPSSARHPPPNTTPFVLGVNHVLDPRVDDVTRKCVVPRTIAERTVPIPSAAEA
jgi:NADPH:quinone reductase-like Zn-dependent oxidoreductase